MHHRLLALLLAVAALALTAAAQAGAESNPPAGTDLKPVLGFSTWSSMRMEVGASQDEAQALALKSSGLEGFGFDYFNQDDGWYVCPGPQGPAVDAYGRWTTDATRFPAGPGGENGMQVLATYIHGLGMKFGIYVTPGISKQAVAEDTPILGTPYDADEIATRTPEDNYNCGGMVGIDYERPGAQAFIDSIVDEFAGWGVDFIKLDGIENRNVADIEAFSEAIRQAGRPMQLDVTEGEYTPALAPTLERYATQWESTDDVECYGCARHGSPFPLTSWRHVSERFKTLSEWGPLGGQAFDGYNDFDSVEVGDCDKDGLDPAERESVLSLWSLASSPLLLGASMRSLCAGDLALLENPAVLALDQDGISGRPVRSARHEEVIAKATAGGEAVVGLFDTSARARTIATSAAELGLPACAQGYALRNLWTGAVLDTSGAINEPVASRGVALMSLASRCSG